MLFSRARVVLNFNYHLDTEMLHRTMGPIKDLGILFDAKLKFDCHISYIFHRSNKILGFIHRNCVDFIDKHALKSINCSLIRSIYEYSSKIWFSYQIGLKLKLEKIQQTFLRFISFKCSIPKEPNFPYLPLCLLLISKN